jgi:hypothetical protein
VVGGSVGGLVGGSGGVVGGDGDGVGGCCGGARGRGWVRASTSFHKQLTKDTDTVTRRHLLVSLTGQGAVSHPHRDEEP